MTAVLCLSCLRQCKLIGDRVLPLFVICQVRTDQSAAHPLIECTGIHVLRNTIADEGRGITLSAKGLYMLNCRSADTLPLIFGDDLQGLQGNHIGLMYRQIANILTIFLNQIHRICRIIDP